MVSFLTINKVMTMKKRIVAAIILTLLIVVPFIEWRMGALMWMSAWIIFILQKLFSRQEWNLGNEPPDESGDREQDKHGT